MADRFRRDATGTSTDSVAPDEGAQGRVDPSLAQWAHFSLGIGTDFGPARGFRGYDSRTHRYKGSYINPTSYDLMLDAKLGMQQGAKSNVVNVRRNPAIDSAPTTSAELGELVREDPPWPPGIDTSPGEPLIPSNLEAFQWIVVSADGNFRNSQLVRRPVKPMQIAHFKLPSEGEYAVTCA